MRRIDVSMPLFAGMPAFPGDPAFVLEPVDRIEKGDAYSLSRITLGTHAGTHVDPPVHFDPRGTTVDRLDLEVFQGPCRVVDVPVSVAAIGPAEVRAVPRGCERVLFRTRNSERWSERLAFFPDFVALTLAGARELRERGTRLVGIDALSVEAELAGRFPVHRELLTHGVPIVEGLLLASAPEGEYDLDCLPIRLRDGDGAPARAVLRTR